MTYAPNRCIIEVDQERDYRKGSEMDYREIARREDRGEEEDNFMGYTPVVTESMKRSREHAKHMYQQEQAANDKAVEQALNETNEDRIANYQRLIAAAEEGKKDYEPGTPGYRNTTSRIAELEGKIRREREQA